MTIEAGLRLEDATALGDLGRALVIPRVHILTVTPPVAMSNGQRRKRNGMLECYEA